MTRQEFVEWAVEYRDTAERIREKIDEVNLMLKERGADRYALENRKRVLLEIWHQCMEVHEILMKKAERAAL